MIFRGQSSFQRVRSSIAAHVRYAPVALSLVLAAGCASAAANAGSPGAPSSSASTAGVVIVRDDANGKTVNVPAGAKVELILGSTYWVVAGSSVPGVLRQDGSPTPLPRPTNCPNVPGLGCAPLRTDFAALVPGSSLITANRKTCGEAMPCTADKQHFAVTVVVK